MVKGVPCAARSDPQPAPCMRAHVPLQSPSAQLRVLDTGSPTAPRMRPPAHVTILPRSLELLSHALLPPPPAPGSAAAQQPQQREGGAQCHGVCVSVLGSRWAAPIILPLSGADRCEG